MLDAMLGGTAIRQDDSLLIQHDYWKGYASTAASGASYRASETPGTSATLYFKGTGGIQWVTATGPAMGKADVYVDGVLQTEDLYAPTAHWQVIKTYPLVGGEGGH